MTFADFLSREPDALRKAVRAALAGFADSAEVKLVRAKPGQNVMTQGQGRGDLYLLLSGRAMAVTQQANYASYAFYEFAPLELFGEQETLAGMPIIAADIRAKTACRFLAISEADYLRWVQSDTGIMQKRVRYMLNQLLDQASRERSALFLSSTARLAGFLAAYYEGHAKARAEDGTLAVRQTRVAVAEEIGVSLRTVNRCVEKLQRCGAIGLSRGKPTITADQYEALKKHSGGI
ncbi:Crp/Fnr family transcriptional regulator [Ruminococcaceae bacterium OttesenSCG-928-D13]|nr:Crp/Fnr family transcriptional regulator [Ruminococcaceae bacterium OttesenSCG-928-D13]